MCCVVGSFCEGHLYSLELLLLDLLPERCTGKDVHCDFGLCLDAACCHCCGHLMLPCLTERYCQSEGVRRCCLSAVYEPLHIAYAVIGAVDVQPESHRCLLGDIPCSHYPCICALSQV